MPEKDVVELRWLFAVIRRWWWLVVGCTVLAGGIAYAVTSQMRPVYSASATLLVNKAPTVGGTDYNDIRASEQLANTYSRMAGGRLSLEMAITELGLGESPAALAKRVSVESVSDTRLIRLSVEDTDPNQAALIANTVAEAFIARAQALEAEQYTDLQTSLQARMAELSVEMEGTQAEIDTLRASTILAQVSLTRKEELLADYRSDYRALQQDHEDLRMAVSQLQDSLNVIEAAQVPGDLSRSPYTSTVTLLVGQLPVTVQADYSASLDSERLASTYTQLLARRQVLEEAIARLGLRDSPDALAERVNAESVPDTPLIRLSVEDADPSQAALLANTIAEVFIEQAQALGQESYRGLLSRMQEQTDEFSTLIEDTQAEINAMSAQQMQEQAELVRQEDLLAEYRSEYRTRQRDLEELRLTMVQSSDNVSVIEAAHVARNPVRPNKLLNTLLAAMVGAVLAGGAAFLIEHLADTIKTPQDVSQVLGLHTLGSIGRLAKGKGELVVVTEPRSPVAESFRVLLTNIRFSSVDSPLRTLLVTSPQPSEGKTLVAANLATATARAGLDAVVVDADLRRPRLHRLFGLDARNGLTESIVAGNVDGRLQPTEVDGLVALTSGGLPPNPAELLGSPRMQELLEQLADQADMVLLDAPPILPAADAAVLAGRVDGVLLVLNAEHTRREEAQRAVERLNQVGAGVLGVVLNGLPMPEATYYKQENGRPTRLRRDWKRPLTAISGLVKRLDWKRPLAAASRLVKKGE